MLNSLYGNLEGFVEMRWPTLFISLILLISVRLSYIWKHKCKFVLHKEILLLFFALYILCLFQVVTAQDINISNGNNFIPFAEILRYKPLGRLFVKNIIGNVIMFLPYGFFVGKYASGKNFILTILLIFLASFSIEFTQLAIGRIFDVDDIILNVLGGILGYIIYLFFERIYNILPKIFKTDIFLNILSIIFFGLVVSGIVFMII